MSSPSMRRILVSQPIETKKIRKSNKIGDLVHNNKTSKQVGISWNL